MSAVLTRRAALSGAVASVALVGAAAPVVAMPGATARAPWDAAFACWSASFAAAVAADWDDPQAIANSDEWGALMLVPAPDARALHWKLDQLFGGRSDDGYCDNWATELTDAVIADAARLAKMEG